MHDSDALNGDNRRKFSKMKHILLLKSKTLPKKYPTSNLEECTKMLLSLTYQLIRLIN